MIDYFRARNRASFLPIDDNLTKLFSVQLLIEKIEFDFLSVKMDRTFLIKSVVCLAVAILLFVTQTITHLIAGRGGIDRGLILFIITRTEIEEILLEIEWSTLLFFAGLFILVGAMEQKGVIEWLAHNIFLRVGSNPYIMTLMVLWVSGIVSGFMDNIPFTITMIPIVKTMLAAHPDPPPHPVVGAVPGRLSGRQFDPDRGFGQHRFGRPCSKSTGMISASPPTPARAPPEPFFPYSSAPSF